MEALLVEKKLTSFKRARIFDSDIQKVARIARALKVRMLEKIDHLIQKARKSPTEELPEGKFF